MTDSGRNLSDTAKASLYAQETSEAWIQLITIDHTSFTEPVRVCSDPFELLPTAGVRGVVSNGVEYVFFPFEIELPKQDDTGIATARITMDNISREVIARVRNADSALTITIELVLASDPDNVETSITDFRLERVTYDALTITGDISVEYFDLEPFPARRFTPSDFPGIF